MLFLSSSSFQFQFHFISMLRFPGSDHWETETPAEVITLEVGSCNENYMRITSWRTIENSHLNFAESSCLELIP